MGLIELSKFNYFPSRKPNVKLFNHGALPFLACFSPVARLTIFTNANLLSLAACQSNRVK